MDFGAKEEAHVKVTSWTDAKKVFKDEFNEYETIVVDLTEDLFMWCELEWCKKNGVEHPSDLGWGKGYSGPRNEFFVEISKLLAKDKNIVLLMHGEVITLKNKRGVEYNTYRPTSRIPDKLLDQLEGRVRYFLRCYMKAEETEDGTLVKKRYLSLIPKENEFGISRGLDENTIPHDIPLDFDEFAKYIKLYSNKEESEIQEKPKKEIKKTTKIKEEKIVEEVKKEQIVEEKTNNDSSEIVENNNSSETIEEKTNNEKLDAIKAKLAALKANQK